MFVVSRRMVMGWWKGWIFFHWVPQLNTIFSIKTHIRDGDIDYAVTAQSWLNFLYTGYSCNPLDLEKGLFKSKILVKVFNIVFQNMFFDNDNLIT